MAHLLLLQCMPVIVNLFENNPETVNGELNQIIENEVGWVGRWVGGWEE